MNKAELFNAGLMIFLTLGVFGVSCGVVLTNTTTTYNVTNDYLVFSWTNGSAPQLWVHNVTTNDLFMAEAYNDYWGCVYNFRLQDLWNQKPLIVSNTTDLVKLSFNLTNSEANPAGWMIVNLTFDNTRRFNESLNHNQACSTVIYMRGWSGTAEVWATKIYYQNSTQGWVAFGGETEGLAVYPNTTNTMQISNGLYTIITGKYNLTSAIRQHIGGGYYGFYHYSNPNPDYYFREVWSGQNLGTCSEYNSTQTIKFNFKDELNSSAVTGSINIKITDLDTEEVHYLNYTNTNNATVCYYPFAGSKNVKVELTYSATGYDNREYYILNTTLNTTLQTYDLMFLDGSRLDLTVLDAYSNPYENIYVKIIKDYAGIKRTVTMLKTNPEGKDSTYIDVNGQHYSMEFYNSLGELLDQTTDPIKYVPSGINSWVELTWRINPSGAYEPFVLNTFFSQGIINDTNNITFWSQVIDYSSLMNSVTLNITDLTNYMNKEYYNCYNSTVYSSTFKTIRVYCNVGEVDEKTLSLVTTITTTGGSKYLINTKVINYSSVATSLDGVLIAAVLIIALILIFANPMLSILMAVGGLMMLSILGVIIINPIAVVGLLISGLIVAYVVMKRG